RYAWQYLLGTGRAQLRREIEAQLAAFAATGLRLAHLDGHLNMHLHPMVLPILLELAPRFGIRAMRLSREDLGAALRYDRSHFPRKLAEGVVFHALAAYAAPRLRAAGIATADRVCGMHQTGHVDERYLLALVAALPPGVSEVYCHPAEGVAPAMAPYQQGYDHAGELAALTSGRERNDLGDASSPPARGGGLRRSTPRARGVAHGPGRRRRGPRTLLPRRRGGGHRQDPPGGGAGARGGGAGSPRALGAVLGERR